MLHLPPVAGACAFFFDFDGTLADIAALPEAVQVDRRVPAALQTLHRLFDGAVAVISGRPVAELDLHLSPARLPAAGVHGAERRRGDASWQRVPVPDVGPARELLAPWVALHPGLRLEIKSGALALHYRGAEALAPECLAMMQQAGARVAGTVLLQGKMVIELKPQAADKGRAVAAFMAEAPFAGRRPWFFGDDVTDEAAFVEVLALGGVAVKVGDGPSAAPWRLPEPAALRAWLDRVATAGAPT